MTPLKRLYNLLSLDKKDVYQLFFYAVFAGIISMSLPLGIQAIINLIQSGRVSVSWIVLVALVVVGAGLVGILALMQLRITENLQQKIFVRASFEFAYRLPKIKFEALYNSFPPELANRFFDTLTIQKGCSKLLIDFSAAILQIVFGIILLSLYHPYFLFFGVLLLFALYFIFKFSYNDGLETSLKESKYKYKVASWLQELARNNFSFRNEHNFNFGLQKNDKLVSEYLYYREKHFNVIKKQFSQLIVFKVVITASLLIIGGILVLSQEMNIGQFVAAEIVILLVISSVEKIILGLETLYDVLTSIEKIGQVTDLDLEKEYESNTEKKYLSKINLEVQNLSFQFPGSQTYALKDISLQIKQGEQIFVSGKNGSGKTTLLRTLSGLLEPKTGTFFINDDTFTKINLMEYRNRIGSIVHGETLFEGTIYENLNFGQPIANEENLKWALDGVQLTDFIKSLPEGLETAVFQEGRQLSASNAQKILLARSILHKPKILFYEDPTDVIDSKIAKQIIDFITDPIHKWTVLVSSKNQYWKTKCNREIQLKNGTIILDK